MTKYDGTVYPGILEKLEKSKDDSMHCFPNWSGRGEFEVDCFAKTFVVNIESRTCLCRMWDLTGIPCKHAIACIYMNQEKPEDYINACYSKEMYLRAYNHMIHAVPGMHDWV